MIGSHILKNKSYYLSIKKNIDLAKSFGIDFRACQFFVVGPQNSKVTLNEDIESLKKLTKNIYTIIHSSYINKPFTVSKNKKISSFSLFNIKRELNLANSINADGYNIHLDKNSIIDNYNIFFKNFKEYIGNLIIYLENIPSFKNSYDIFNEIVLNNDNIKIGICIDTAHAWSSGIDISDDTILKNYINKFKTKYFMFHFNDNLNYIGFKRDIHTSISKGKIWKNSKSFLVILKFAIENNYPIIFERKKMCLLKNDYAVLNQYI